MEASIMLPYHTIRINIQCLFFTTSDSSTTADTAGTTSGDKTTLLAGRRVASASRGMTNVLVVTTTMRVLDGVHRNTSDLWPAVALNPVLVVRTASLEHRFVEAATSSDDANGSAAIGRNGLFNARRQTNLRGVGVLDLRDDCAVCARSTADLATITSADLDVGDNSTFRHGLQRKNIADVQVGLGSTVEELTGEDTIGRNETSLLPLVLVWVLEDNVCDGGATATLVHDILHNALDVAIALSIVQAPVLGWSLAQALVGLEDRPGSLTLCTENTPHVVPGWP